MILETCPKCGTRYNPNAHAECYKCILIPSDPLETLHLVKKTKEPQVQNNQKFNSRESSGSSTSFSSRESSGSHSNEQKCYIHPESTSIAKCVECGKFVCNPCCSEVKNKSYCKVCVVDIS